MVINELDANFKSHRKGRLQLISKLFFTSLFSKHLSLANQKKVYFFTFCDTLIDGLEIMKNKNEGKSDYGDDDGDDDDHEYYDDDDDSAAVRRADQQLAVRRAQIHGIHL